MLDRKATKLGDKTAGQVVEGIVYEDRDYIYPSHRLIYIGPVHMGTHSAALRPYVLTREQVTLVSSP